MQMPFSEKIKSLRMDYPEKLSQEDLAKVLNIKQRKVSYWETGENEPSLEDIRNICRFFNVSADYLLDLPKGLPYPK